jgi:50S ribosomal protein L16 3-hydroxylase
MSAAQFLERYWQKHPVLIRGAFPGFVCPIAPNDLAGVACEALALSRLVVHEARGDRWHVRSGPFTERDFTRLPKRDWTLLVQDCDKLLAEIDALRTPFRFIPDWRVDDVMISYAAPQGSVGAHIDQYDVFLLQGMGRRRWRISTDPHAPRAFRPNVALRLLQQFRATHEWVLQPGDMLYLPPNVPHHGVALDECMTLSFGMRAPALSELVYDFVSHMGERWSESQRYTDTDLSPSDHPSELGADALARVQALLARATRSDPTMLRDWLARFLSRYRSTHAPAPRKRPLLSSALLTRLRRGAEVHRSPWSRYVYTRAARGAALYLAGQRYDGSLALARLLEANPVIASKEYARLSPQDRRALLCMINDGHFALSRD